jgi:hypothetical protein
MGLANRSGCENLLGIVRDNSLAWRPSDDERGPIPVSPEVPAVHTCSFGGLDLKQLLSSYQPQY